ncbi:MAG: phage holin family protein [Bacteroidota bacterium]
MEYLLLLDTAPVLNSNFLIKILLNALALFGAAYLMKGVDIKDFLQAILIAAVLAVLNATLGQVLDFVTMPIRILTLGLFSFVVDAIVLWVAASFFEGFKLKSFWTAVLLAVVLAIFNAVLYHLYF